MAVEDCMEAAAEGCMRAGCSGGGRLGGIDSHAGASASKEAAAVLAAADDAPPPPPPSRWMHDPARDAVMDGVSDACESDAANDEVKEADDAPAEEAERGVEPPDAKRCDESGRCAKVVEKVAGRPDGE